MRAGSIVTEAWRNLTSGTVRGALFAIALVVGLATLIVADARTLVAANQDVAEWRASGAAVVVLWVPSSIDGATCEALVANPRIAASGAMRAREDFLPVLALPDGPVPYWEATPGLAALLTTAAQGEGADDGGPQVGTDARAGGVVVSASLSQALGREAGGSIETSWGDAWVAGVYPTPVDGRQTQFSYAAMALVPPLGRFDACWAEVWPPDERVAAILHTAVASDAPQDVNRSLEQFNPTRGSMDQIADQYAGRPTGHAPLVASVLGLALGFVAVRRRRLELASALHAGLGRAALMSLVLVETIVWTLLAAAIVAPVAVWAATWGNPYSASPALAVCGVVIGFGVVGAWIGAGAALVVTRESHLFGYFKTRT